MDKRTINQCLKETVQLYRDKEAITDFGLSYTWGAVYVLTLEMSNMLKQLGIKKGTHVAVWMDNSVRWIVLYFALHNIGAVPVLINVAYKWRELEATFATCDVEYVFYSPKYKDSDHLRTIRQLNLEHLPKFREAFLVDTVAMRVPDREEVLAACDAIDVNNDVSVSEDVCSILFTSGTTGKSKGAMLTHSNIVNNSKAIVTRLEWDSNDKHCFVVPMYHCFGITVGIMGAVHTGASMHLVRKFKPALVFEMIERHKCNIFNGVPTMFLAMRNSADRHNYDISSLKGGLMAGSAILPNEYLDICNEFGLDYLNTAFGQTESSPAISVSCNADSRAIRSVSAGRLLPDVEVKIRNAGEIIGDSIDGEIMTRGYHVMKGYYNMPEETQKAVDKEGWLATGDLGHLDADGYLHVTGRIKDIIVRGGENISPAEVEQVICQIPWVKTVKVVGVPADIIQEEVVACVIPKEKGLFNESEVKGLVSTWLADYKVPRYVLEFEEFPMNANGKVLTPKVSEKCVELLKK